MVSPSLPDRRDRPICSVSAEKMVLNTPSRLTSASFQKITRYLPEATGSAFSPFTACSTLSRPSAMGSSVSKSRLICAKPPVETQSFSLTLAPQYSWQKFSV